PTLWIAAATAPTVAALVARTITRECPLRLDAIGCSSGSSLSSAGGDGGGGGSCAKAGPAAAITSHDRRVPTITRVNRPRLPRRRARDRSIGRRSFTTRTAPLSIVVRLGGRHHPKVPIGMAL